MLTSRQRPGRLSRHDASVLDVRQRNVSVLSCHMFEPQASNRSRFILQLCRVFFSHLSSYSSVLVLGPTWSAESSRAVACCDLVHDVAEAKLYAFLTLYLSATIHHLG